MTETIENRSPAQHAVADHLRLLTTGRLDSELRGREALITHMRNFVATFDVQAVNLRYIATASPQTAVALWTLDGTATPTGKRFHQDCFGIVRTDADGLITRYDDYWNPLAAVEALTPSDPGATGTVGVAGSFGS
jgi:uncharacterized protein